MEKQAGNPNQMAVDPFGRIAQRKVVVTAMQVIAGVSELQQDNSIRLLAANQVILKCMMKMQLNSNRDETAFISLLTQSIRLNQLKQFVVQGTGVLQNGEGGLVTKNTTPQLVNHTHIQLTL